MTDSLSQGLAAGSSSGGRGGGVSVSYGLVVIAGHLVLELLLFRV